MKKALFVAAAVFLIQLTVIGQEIDQAELKEYFYDAEFFFAQEAYTDALYDYMELYNNGYNTNANINYRIGICYLNIPGQKDKAISYLQEAVKNISSKYRESNFKQVTAPFDTYLYLGNAYRVNNLLSKAIDAYAEYKKIAKDQQEIDYADQQIIACNTAIRFMDDPTQMIFTNIGDSVNGTSSNYKGVISGDGKTLVYMNELPFYNAVYFSRFIYNMWSAPVNITPQIQSDGDQYVSSISYDGKTLYLTKEDAFNSDIYYSVYEDGRWSKSEPIVGTDINTKYWESHASVSKDGQVMYFTSNRKNSLGNMDIYKAILQDNGQWGEPVNVGEPVNTSFNEDTPFITDNDSLLFFSSQGHENMGGYDIFKSRLGADGKWSRPENLKFPVNTTDDDLFYYPWHNNRIGYLSVIRPEGYGKEDIYAVQEVGDIPLSQLLAQLVPGDEEMTDEQTDSMVMDTGNAETFLPPVVEEQTDTSATEVPEQLPEQGTPKIIELEPVYFTFDNFQLNDNGRKQLDKIHQLMTDFPAVHVRLIGHADAKGPADYNLRLSEKRAEAAMQYLIDTGIDPGNLRITGMGEKNFAAINSNPDGTDNPDGRRLNRRVEYEITGTDDGVITIKIPEIPENLRFRE